MPPVDNFLKSIYLSSYLREEGAFSFACAHVCVCLCRVVETE